MSTTLPLFWHLSSSSKPERIEASVKLVGALEQFQAKFTPFPPESSSEEDQDADADEDNIGALNDGLDGPNAPDVSYSIRRLVRGLASPRESSRLGFAVALTELLSRLDTVSASQIISLIRQASQIHGSMKGQEERDMLFARLFGITSLTQSGILFRASPLATSSIPSCTLKDFQDAMEILLALPAKKSFLKEPSYWAYIQALRALDASRVEWKSEAWKWIAETIFIEDKTWSPEKVAIALSLQTLGIDLDWKTLIGRTFKNGDILLSGNLSNLAKILRDADIENPDTETTKSKSSAAWRPQLHFVWNLIFDIYFPPNGAPPSKFKTRASFPEFFKTTVDDSLLASTSSDGRKLWGFELFRLALTRVPASDIPRMFTPNFMRSWVNHLAKGDRYLHKAAKLVASSLPPVITANPSAGFPVLLQLLQTHGHFDRLTRTKTVELLLTAMDVNGVEEYVSHLRELARKPNREASGVGEDDPTLIRIWVADQFTMLIRNSAIPKTDVWVSSVLNFLALHGIYGIRKRNEKSKNVLLHVLPEPAFSDEARTACRVRLLSCLAELTTQTSSIKITGEKSVRVTGVASDGELWVSKVLLGIVDLAKDSKHFLRLGLTEEEVHEELVLTDKALEVIERLKAVKQSRKEEGEGAELLLVATLLHHYLDAEQQNNEDVETCLNNITRLFSDSALDTNKKKKKERELTTQDENANEDNVTPIGTVVDTLIGYLEHSTAYLRAVANQVFGLLTALVDRDTLDLILAQLERRDPAQSEDDEEEEGEGKDDEEQAENATGVEDNNSPNSSGNDSEDSEDVGEDPELRQKIDEALRSVGIKAATEDTEDEASGSDAASTDEDVMDDDQMMQLDSHLAEIFRSRTKAKGRGDSGAQREATHFKNRVLDLVDIFMRKEPTSQLAPTTILPLVQVIIGTGPDEKQLSDKVIALLRNRFGKAKEIPSMVDVPQAQKTLEELHAMARKSHSPDVREAISACSLYLARILLSEPINDGQTVINAYRSSLADFATRKASPLQPSFLRDFVQRQPRSAWQMRNDFVRVAEIAVNLYRKCQIFNLLNPLFHQLAGIDSDRSEIIAFLKTFGQAVYTIVSEACDDPESLTSTQMKELMKLSLLAIRQTKRATSGSSDLHVAFAASDWTLLLQNLKVSRFKTATSLHVMCQQLLAAVRSNTEGVVVEDTKGGNQKKRKAGDAKNTNAKRPRRKGAKGAEED